MPAVEALCGQYEEVYGATAFPLLYKSVPNFKPLNPFKWVDYGGEWKAKHLNASYYEHCHDTSGEFVAPFIEDKGSDDNCVIKSPMRFNGVEQYTVELNLGQFQPGHNMIRNCLSDWCPDHPVLRLPAYPKKFDHLAYHFLRKVRGIWPLLFHSSDQSLSGEVSERCCPNHVFEGLRQRLQKFALYDARKCDSDRPLLFPQHQVPVYHSSGWIGLCGIMALIKQSAGVVLQRSCSLLPIAQALGKPVLVLNGTCGLKLEHCTDDGLPPEQRRHVWVEPENPCWCKTTGESCKGEQPVYDFDDKLKMFISEAIQQ